jgi:hypothetical protein
MTDMECVDEWATAVEKFNGERVELQKYLREGDINRESFNMSVRKLNTRMMERWDEIRAQCPKAPL